MDYYVFNENNCRQKVTDEQLEAAFLQMEDDYTDAVIQGLEAVSKAMERHNLLEQLSDNYYSKLAVTGKKLLGMKLDSIVKETVAEFSKGFTTILCLFHA